MLSLFQFPVLISIEFSSDAIPHIPVCCPDPNQISLRGDTTAGRHQGLKIFSTSIIRAGALNTGIYIQRVYAHVQVLRVCVYASREHSSTYRVPWSTDICQGEQMTSLLALLATTVDTKGRLEHQERKTHVSFRSIYLFSNWLLNSKEIAALSIL